MRTILHSDIDNCYANIELLHRPELRGRPVAVSGDPEARHGIVLAKDQLAKRAGVKTGMALWEAQRLCPQIVFLPANMQLYLRFSRLAHDIYRTYTDRQEAFGVDESWLDVTGCAACRGDGVEIAREISKRIRFELGITVSIGVSWNKIFAKLGSDYQKPNGITAITKENYQDVVWPLPVERLLYVGRATKKKLNACGIYTIGQLAESQPSFLQRRFGKMGRMLHAFANGEDRTPVSAETEHALVKSIGNSTTTPRDLLCEQDVKIVAYVLAESVSAQLRDQGVRCRVVELSVRDNELHRFTRQKTLKTATDLTAELAETAMQLFREHYDWGRPIRSIGVRACSLERAETPVQLDLFVDEKKREQLHDLDVTVDTLRRRFGFHAVQRGLMYQDRRLSHLNAKEDNRLHPVGFFQQGNRTGVE